MNDIDELNRGKNENISKTPYLDRPAECRRVLFPTSLGTVTIRFTDNRLFDERVVCD